VSRYVLILDNGDGDDHYLLPMLLGPFPTPERAWASIRGLKSQIYLRRRVLNLDTWEVLPEEREPDPRGPPAWSVVCRDCPNIVHARDDGHVCVDPELRWPPGAGPMP
jgi:hypothetical protein